MPLFQSSILKKYLADLDPAKVQAAFAVFQQHFAGAAKQENIRNAKEEQFQEGFLRELFVDALGYTLNPSPDLTFADFLKEVKKQKIAWSLKEESEWLEHFTGEQAAARALWQEIEKTDREIDGMVYTLYGLTEAEVALVEGKG